MDQPVAGSPLTLPNGPKWNGPGQPSEAEMWQLAKTQTEHMEAAGGVLTPAAPLQTETDSAVILQLRQTQETVAALASQVEQPRRIQLPTVDDIRLFREELATARERNDQYLREMQAWWEKRAA